MSGLEATVIAVIFFYSHSMYRKNRAENWAFTVMIRLLCCSMAYRRSLDNDNRTSTLIISLGT